MQRASRVMFIFTWTFQELTAIPLSGELNFSAIFQTPDTVSKLPLTLVWDNEEWISYSRFHLDDSSWKWGTVKWKGLFIHLLNPAAPWRGETCGEYIKKKGKIPSVAIYSSAVRTQRCFFGCHSRLAWDLYLNSWQSWQCSFSTWLPQRPL